MMTIGINWRSSMMALPRARKSHRYDFDSPDICRSIDSSTFRDLRDVDDRGGLFVASRPGVPSRAVIIPPTEIASFRDLGVDANFQLHGEDVESVVKLIALAALWSGARVPGDIVATIRQRAVLTAIVEEIFRRLGGTMWAATERKLRARDPEALQTLKRLVNKPKSGGPRLQTFGRSLRHRSHAGTGSCPEIS